jgi:hypothetical protein
MRPELAPYVKLARMFVAGDVSGLGFEQTFLAAYKTDPTRWTEPEFENMERLFYATDAFVADEALLDPSDLDEAQLQAAATAFLKAVEATE